MSFLECVKEIDAPPREVFAVMSDPRRWPEVLSAVTGLVVLDDGPIVVGSCFTETRRIFGREASETMTVSEITPPTRFVTTSENHGAVYRAEHVLDDVPGGGTRVLMRFEARPVTLLAKVLSPLAGFMAGALRKTIERDLDDLAAYCEARAGTPS